MKRNLIYLLASMLCLFVSCTKISREDTEVVSIANFPAGLPQLVPVETYEDDVLILKTEYKNGKLVRAYSPSNFFEIKYSYDEQERTIEQLTQGADFVQTSKQFFDNNGKLIKFEGETFFNSVKIGDVIFFNTWNGNQLETTFTRNNFYFENNVDLTETTSTYTYRGQQLVSILNQDKYFQNGIHFGQFENLTSYTWQGPFNLNLKNDFIDVRYKYSPSIKNPAIFDLINFRPGNISAKNVRDLQRKFTLDNTRFNLETNIRSGENNNLNIRADNVRTNRENYPTEYDLTTTVNEFGNTTSTTKRYRIVYSDLADLN